MVLFVSDLHLGIGAPDADRETERSLLTFLRAHRDGLEHLVLLGDVFDHYIEYRHLIPKGGTRLMGHLASLTDAGVGVTYCAGNHDPWHRDYFAEELGVQVVPRTVRLALGGARAHLAHGDVELPRPAWKQRIRSLLRHPAPVWLYRTLLPGDVGLALARYASHRSDGTTPERDVLAQRALAFRILDDARAAKSPLDLVAFGHVHRPTLVRAPDSSGGGLYLNPGAWYASQTAGILTGGTLRLVQWPRGATHANDATLLESAALDTSPIAASPTETSASRPLPDPDRTATGAAPCPSGAIPTTN